MSTGKKESIGTHRGYTLYLEFGCVVGYKTTSSTFLRKNDKGGEERRKNRIDRIVTSAKDIQEAYGQIDRRLKKQGDPRSDLSGNMTIFDAGA